MRRQILGVVAVLTAATVLLTACGGSSKTTADSKGSGAKEAVFYGGWPYELPPKTNFNWFDNSGLGLGGSPYTEMMFEPLAEYYWATDKWEPLLATDWTQDTAANTITVHLRKGVKWSDGSDFKAQDLVNTMTIEKAEAYSVWRYVDKVTAKDEYTVEFHMGNPTSIALLKVLKTEPVATSQYGDFAKQLQALFDAGKAANSDEVAAVVKQMEAMRPQSFVVTGPFNIDPAQVTQAQMTLKKVTTAWDAATVKFDKIVLYNGETAAVTPLILDKKIDFATHAFPPATEKQFSAQNIRIIRYPSYSGPALFFNFNVYPLNVKEVRQAIAYAINRDENGTVALSKSGVAVKYMTGFSDNFVPNYMNDADVQKLNHYDFNTAKAEELLKSIHFTKGADGIWVDDKGKQLSFQIEVPSDFADWSASADNVAQQLNKFGIKAAIRGVPSSQAPGDVRAGKFDIAYRLYGSSVAHPSFGFTADFITYNNGGFKGDKEKPGINFPLKQKYSGGDIDFNEMTTASAAGLDIAQQKVAIGKTAVAFNELLPVVPLFERYFNSPALENVHVSGWPADGDPILKNGGSDNFVTMLVLTGKMGPAK